MKEAKQYCTECKEGTVLDFDGFLCIPKCPDG